MRIQHNIMAMSAYRNYTNNVSAMKKNLEKLSSGYKINRAGDDAAGLAISEKMRAQITGLETAQKNAKDGISLVQTAEGALTEVHDMLNRMVELATMSANGTYDNDTDRAQLQKEMDQLTSEINRIADSANFNGIKLLDGSMDSKAGLTGVEYEAMKDVMNLFVNKDTTGINQNDPLGGKDIMEKGGQEKSDAGFEIDLDGIGTINIEDGQKFAITIGDKELTSDALTEGSYTGKDLAAKLDGKEVNLTANGETYVFTAKADGGKLTFTTESEEDFQLNANAQVGWKVLAAETPEEPVEVPATVEGELTATTSTALDGSGPVAKQVTADLTVAGAENLIEGDKITVGGNTYTVVDGGVHEIRGDEVDLNEINTEEGLKKFIAEKLNDADANYDISVGEDGNLVYEAYDPSTAPANPTAPTATQLKIEDKAGTAHASASATVANVTPVANTGTAAVNPTKFIKLSDADNDAIAAAAEAAGAADGAKLTIKVDGTNNKAQLFAGDKMIGEADYTADGTASTTVTFKDADGNALMKASLVKVEGDEDAIKDGFDTGLTYKAASTTTASEDGLMALADDTTATAKKPAVTATDGKDAGPGFTAGSAAAETAVTALASTDLSDDSKVQAAIDTIKAETLTFGSGDSQVTVDLSALTSDNTATADAVKAEIQQMINDAFAAKDTALAAGSATYDKFSNAVVTLDANGISVAFDKATQTYSTTGTPAAGAKVEVDFDGLTGTDVIGDTVKIGDKTYEFVKTGGDVTTSGNVKVEVGESDNAAALTTAFKAAVDGALPSGTAAATSGTTVTVTTTATGATATLEGSSADAAGETTDPGTTTPPSVSGTNNILGDLSSNTDLSTLDDFTADTALTDAQVTALGTALSSLGSNTGKIILQDAGNAEVDLSNLDLSNATTVGDVAEAVYNAAKAAVDEVNANAAEGATKYEVVGVYADANFTELLAGPGEAASSQALSPTDGFYIKTKEVEAPADDNTVAVKGGTINSGLQNVTDNYTGASDQLAHVVVDFSKGNAWTDGAKITIGDETYTVALGADSKFKGSANVIDLTDMEAGSVKNDVAAQRLTVAANGNKTFVVGHDGTGQTVLKQRTDVKDKTDMETQEKISKYLGVSTADAESVKNAAMGKGLTLQIGDTAEDFNKLVVNIKDMHAESLGLGDAKISDQDSAAIAIDKIKAAINTVSDVRGTLGATQNRLDHTINNLSVMTENIQDAESTIRDTDVADEMMAYTKNNILIQSAQAMLAQANQVPQGVLQLLQ